MPVIPALGKLRQGAHKFEAGLGYIVRPCLPRKKGNFLELIVVFLKKSMSYKFNMHELTIFPCIRNKQYRKKLNF
jgi:hypothetical protein